MCERGQEASPAQDLAIPAEKVANHAAQSGSPLGHAAHTQPGKGCRDITYIPVKNGFLYLVAIRCPAVVCLQTMRGMDWATRKVLTWRLSNTLDARFCPLGRLRCNRLPAMVEALEEAIARYGKPEIMNTPSRALLCNTLPGRGSG